MTGAEARILCKGKFGWQADRLRKEIAGYPQFYLLKSGRSLYSSRCLSRDDRLAFVEPLHGCMRLDRDVQQAAWDSRHRMRPRCAKAHVRQSAHGAPNRAWMVLWDSFEFFRWLQWG